MSKLRILYLEDDLALGALTMDVLQKAGFEVCWKMDGRSALQSLQQEPFDAGVVDIMMPELDGYSFVTALRGVSISIPIIFVSARVLTEDVLRGFEVGADDYMRKPYSIEELIVRINRLIQAKPPAGLAPGDSGIKLGKFYFYPRLMQLRLGTQVTRLSPRTTEVLHLMVTSPDYTIRRREALMELWGDDTFFNGRSLDVFISKLRKLLAADPNLSIISIRGLAYRLLIAQDT